MLGDLANQLIATTFAQIAILADVGLVRMTRTLSRKGVP
jgi:hypothetical protein